MRLEVEVIFFFPEKPMKKINAFLNVNASDSEDDIMDSMVELLSDLAGENEEFSTGIASVMLDDEEMLHLSFTHPDEVDIEGRNECNIIIPDEMTVH